MSIRKVAVIFDNKQRPDTTGVYCRRALAQLVDVEHFLPSEVSRIPHGEFDLFLNIDDGLEYRLPRELRPCAWWAIDTHLNLPWYLTKAPDFDFVFTAQRDGALQLQRAGIPWVRWLPLACDPEIHTRHTVQKSFDVAFVGHIFPGPRADLLEIIQQRFSNHFVGQRFFEEMAITYSAARLVFNRSLRNDINMRVFEALACGSLLLTNDLRDNGQEELFRSGVHLDVYRDAEDLVGKIAYYLKYEAEREQIAAAGRAEVLAKDTYRHRMARLLTEVENHQAVKMRVNGKSAAEAERLVVSPGMTGEKTTPPNPALTSIVIITHNQLSYTRQCVDSIVQFTDEPYEFIFVDNGSTDGTPAYLRSLGQGKLVLNDANLGFPKAANQGIKASSGSLVLLLNNDTVVTTGWLRRLLRALHSDPKIGLVGPCSNFVSGEQQVPVSYDDLGGLEGFAGQWCKENDGRRVEINRLVGFCLLLRKEVIDRIGLLDERFGIGCFEDDDICLRALQAGYRAVIARDSFVHHFGGRTFIASGVDFAALMQKNRDQFLQKWQQPPALQSLGQQPSAQQPYAKLPPAMQSSAQHSHAKQPHVSAPMRSCFSLRADTAGGLLLQKVRLSLCMIVRDNSKTIEACLESIRPWVDEMIVVDTGSKDDTPEKAKKLGAKVFHFPWCDSFSVARNESLRHARGEWIFWMDSDDTISAENGRKLRELALRRHAPDIFGYVMQVHCPGAPEKGGLDLTVVDHVKLFRNLPQIRFSRRIHEQVLPAIRDAGGDVAWTDIFVVHSGSDRTPEGQARKRQRDLHLLELELQEQPDHPFTLFNLGMTHADGQDHIKAIHFLERSLRQCGDTETHLRKVFSLLAYSYGQVGRHDSAWQVCEKGLKLFPEDVELQFRRGLLLHQFGRLREAEEAYLNLLKPSESRYFASFDRGICGFKTRQNLAALYVDMGKWSEAESQWQLVVEEVPQYPPAWRGLAEALMNQGKSERLMFLAQKLPTDNHLAAERHHVLAIAAELEKDWPQAKREFQKAVERANSDSYFLKSQCRFLVDHGDPWETEKALQELIRVEPQDSTAYHNLGTLYFQQKQFAAAVTAYRHSLQHRSNFAHTYRQLGYALSSTGQISEAIEAWDKSLQLSPGDGELLKLVEETKNILAKAAKN